MNIENIDKAIQVMERVARLEQEYDRQLLDMRSFQCGPGDYRKTEEEVLNSCGTTCCFSGWLAVAPEFPELIPDTSGAAMFHGRYSLGPSETLARLFNAPHSIVFGLIFGNDFATAQDVIETLKEWKIDYQDLNHA